MERRRLAVIMFTDMVGYSKKVHQDEDAALTLLAQHNKILGEAIVRHGGNIVKTIGDAFMADFDNAREAVETAVDIQKELVGYNAEASSETQMEVRIGIHIGDVIYRENDVFGDGVNIAARIEALAGAGQILVSGDIHPIVDDKLAYEFADLGDRSLKNITRPVRVYEVRWDPDRPVASLSDESAISGDEKSGSTRSRSGVVTALAVAMLVILTVGVWLSTNDSTDSERPSLAVVGFSDNTGSERLERAQIGKILGDAIVQKFYEMPGIQLVSPLRVMRAKRELGISEDQLADDPSLIEDIASEVDGKLAISGALTAFGDKYILTASLDDVAAGELLGSYRLENSSEDQILGVLVDSLCGQFQERLAEIFGIGVDHEIVGIGALTTTSLDAYAHFVRGFELYQSGVFDTGIDELVRATEIDTNFALAYSVTSCAYAFAKEDSLSNVFLERARRYSDRFTGFSKESLLFRGNIAWMDGDLAQCRQNYELITELYPDDREGFHYTGLYYHYLEGDYERAISFYDEAIALSPEYFAMYRDKAYATAHLYGVESAIESLQGYLREYEDGPGAEHARFVIADLRN
jgi:adenylate cyclase